MKIKYERIPNFLVVLNVVDMIMLYIIFIHFLLFLLLLKKYLLKTRWCKSKVCLSGKTVIVTGSNTGIGYESCLEFAKRGARVILACRDLQKAAQARDKIITLTQNKNVLIKEINFASLNSVKNFAKEINKNEERLDILVNNAGCGNIKHKISDDGLQILMQVNYFGPVLLTILLLDLLKKTGSSRIINVSSLLAKQATLTADNLNKWPKNALANYSNSKLANILFTMKLSELLKGSKVTVYSLHPGAVNTEVFRKLKGWKKIIVNFLRLYIFKTAEEGAQTTIYTALEQEIEIYSGQHFEECRKISPYKTAKDSFLVDQIWLKTIKLLQCENEVKELFTCF